MTAHPVLDFNLINRTKGFMDEEEGLRLYDTALKAADMGPCLEIGSYCGKSTIYLGTAVKQKGGVLFSIDHHRGSEEQQPGEEYFDPDLLDQSTGRIDTFPLFRKTLMEAGLEDTVAAVVASSRLAARMWTGDLSLVFIDGGHAFETAYMDYASWACHLVPGGYLLIHDLFERPEDGGQAPYNVYKLALASGLFEELPRTKSLGVLKRGFDPKVLK